MFSKRHYEAIALAMQTSAPCAPEHNHEMQWAHCVSALADRFEADSGAFDRERFKRACIPGANVRARS